jgi:dihydrofolate reductase
MKKLILYIAMSLDGFIAGPDDDLSFLSAVEQEGEDYGYARFCETVDTIIIGRKSYEKVITMCGQYPHSDKQVYVITRTPQPSENNIHFFSGDLKELVQQLKATGTKNIYCDGGGEIARLLLHQGLIDEMILSIIPVILTAGTALFAGLSSKNPLTLIGAESFKSGLVQLHYQLPAQ